MTGRDWRARTDGCTSSGWRGRVFAGLLVVVLAALPAVAVGQAQGGGADGAGGWVETYDRLLGEYVGSGGVRYRAWHAHAGDRAALAGVVAAVGRADLSGASRDEKLAFYLNAYNAWVLHRILSDYPTDGPGGGGLFGRNRFFKSRSITVAGERTSLHALENEVVRPRFSDPRIHFAINCASASCPPLHGRAFRAATLDKTLDSLTRAFVSDNPDGVSVDGGRGVRVSKIFDWFAEDFEAAGGVAAFINRFRSEPLPAGAKLRFQPYHWDLNEGR